MISKQDYLKMREDREKLLEFCKQDSEHGTVITACLGEPFCNAIGAEAKRLQETGCPTCEVIMYDFYADAWISLRNSTTPQ